MMYLELIKFDSYITITLFYGFRNSLHASKTSIWKFTIDTSVAWQLNMGVCFATDLLFRLWNYFISLILLFSSSLPFLPSFLPFTPFLCFPLFFFSTSFFPIFPSFFLFLSFTYLQHLLFSVCLLFIAFLPFNFPDGLSWTSIPHEHLQRTLPDFYTTDIGPTEWIYLQFTPLPFPPPPPRPI